MLNPLYIEIYQALFALFVVATLALSLWALVRYRDNETKLQNALHKAYLREALRKAQERNAGLPEDWSLRGIPADWEESALCALHRNVHARAILALRLLDDEQFADVILQDTKRRLSNPRVNDKVFTRLAGRTFRSVENVRKSQQQGKLVNA